MNFEHPEDADFFCDLLCAAGESIDRYALLFDFRTAATKRREFQAARASLLAKLLVLNGRVCMLRYSSACEGGKGDLTIDHVIPLSTNKLNKDLRRIAPLPGRKVATQSLGSNHLANLVLACSPCNGAKKHRLLPPQDIRPLLAKSPEIFSSAEPLPDRQGRRR